jgi:hypothetical protein
LAASPRLGRTLMDPSVVVLLVEALVLVFVLVELLLWLFFFLR